MTTFPLQIVIAGSTYTLHVHGSSNSNDSAPGSNQSTVDVTPTDVIRQTGKRLQQSDGKSPSRIGACYSGPIFITAASNTSYQTTDHHWYLAHWRRLWMTLITLAASITESAMYSPSVCLSVCLSRWHTHRDSPQATCDTASVHVGPTDCF